MLRIGGMVEAFLGLDGMEESLHINARIAVMWSSILRSRETKARSNGLRFHLNQGNKSPRPISSRIFAIR